MREQFTVRSIERFTSQAIPVSVIPGLEPKQRVFDKKPGTAMKKFGAKRPHSSGSSFGGGARTSAGAADGAGSKSGAANWSKPAGAFAGKFAGKREGAQDRGWGDRGDKKPSAPRSTQRRTAA